MRILKIENNSGKFLNKDDKYKSLSDIEGKDLLYLIEVLIESDDVTYDAYDKDLLQRKSHRIIYQQISEKFEEIEKNRNDIRRENEDIYSEELKKYA